MIRVLDRNTIEKIAAGEVIERPQSIVKELLENAVDAGATHISVDIRNGGIDMIRITDNGSGIDRNEVRTAFLAHATSKLSKIEDLYSIKSLGFRGEALSSIAAVSKVELLTKTREDPVGIKYVIEGGSEKKFSEAGVPDGTTFIIKDLFYNTPARRKFLKSPGTEAGYISTLVEEMALSNPYVSFKYSVNGSNRILTSGNGDLKEVIYRIYGREISDSLLPLEASTEEMQLNGFITKPYVARSSRAMENYFVNGRYVKDDVMAKAIEDGYAGFLMQHRFPLTVLLLNIPPADLDVNVHPRKMEIKFSDQSKIYDFVRNAVKDALNHREFINDFTFGKEEKRDPEPLKPDLNAPEPFEIRNAPESASPEAPQKISISASLSPSSEPEITGFKEEKVYHVPDGSLKESPDRENAPEIKETPQDNTAFKEEIKGSQLDLFEEKILSKGSYKEFKIVGQIFDTYWIIEYRDEMLLIDQHAAHEKVNYERFMEEFEKRSVTTQNVEPPVIITLTGKERDTLERFLPRFSEMGFEIEAFGENDYAIRTVPYNLYGLNEHEVFKSLLDELSAGVKDSEISLIHDKIASMSCKASIKGNTGISLKEADELITQLLNCKDPYNCPHGRPTTIKMSKKELEKKFRRVL